MIPLSFDQQTGVIPGGESGFDVPFYREGHRFITRWQLNKDELEKIIETGEIWVHVVGNVMPHFVMSGFNPFKKLNPLIANNHINSFLTYVDGEELILLQVKEDEVNFRVIESPEGGGWYELRFKIRGDVDRKWKGSNYAFQEPVEVIGRGEDCPEYSWMLSSFGIQKNHCLILKRVNKTP